MQYDYRKVIIALDTPHEEKALETVHLLKDKISIFKVGLELFCSNGPQIVEKINAQGCKVFLDLKFHDIPNTVAGAVKAALKTNAHMFNVHASGGRKMLTKVQEIIEESAPQKKPISLAVTVLTSLDSSDLKDINISKSPLEQVRALALLTKECGLDGVVASPREVSTIREAVGEDFIIVTPGVRPTWATAGDQNAS